MPFSGYSITETLHCIGRCWYQAHRRMEEQRFSILQVVRCYCVVLQSKWISRVFDVVIVVSLHEFKVRDALEQEVCWQSYFRRCTPKANYSSNGARKCCISALLLKSCSCKDYLLRPTWQEGDCVSRHWTWHRTYARAWAARNARFS